MNYDNTNRFTLGRNRKKENEKHPDFTGKINVEGVDYWLNAWVKEHNGEKFFSGSIKKKEEGNAVPFAKKSAPLREQLSDDIPF